MKYLTCAALLTASLAMAAPAFAARTSGFFALAARGDGNWRVSCSVERGDRGAREIEISPKGREKRKVVAVRGATGGACVFTASGAGPLVLEFTDDHFACPFPEAAGGLCRRTVSPGETGQFNLLMDD